MVRSLTERQNLGSVRNAIRKVGRTSNDMSDECCSQQCKLCDAIIADVCSHSTDYVASPRSSGSTTARLRTLCGLWAKKGYTWTRFRYAVTELHTRHGIDSSRVKLR